MTHTTTRRGRGAVAVLGLLALALGACGGGGEGPADQRCADMARAGLPATSITKASLVAGGSTWPTGVTSGEKLPEHCVVQGRINERTGTDGKPYAVGFELRLPTAWNGRLLYQGGGGNDGVVNEAIGRNTGALGAVDNALLRGFAAVSTDAGHSGTGPEFALDPQARVDHAYNAHDLTATTARTLIQRYYGKAADRSYFIGCSGGGRQGMMFTQRFPGTFDGVVVTAPAMTVAKGATISVANFVQKLTAVAPRDAAGAPLLAQALSSADLNLVADAVKQQCDTADGLADGLISHPEACRFDLTKLQCSGDKTATCLSAAQVGALSAAMAGPRNSSGTALYHPWPWDPGMAAPGWRAWVLGSSATATPNALFTLLMQGALGYEFFTPPAPGFSLLAFNFDTDPARMDAFNRIYETASDVQLAAFKARGGKLLMFHGMADPIFSASESVDYVKRLTAQHGGAAGDLARLFLVPGMNHCSGGPATDAYDGLTAIVDWVEKGQAPASVAARGTASLPGVARPLCAYPTHTHYKGSGDVNAAASFECR